MNLTRPIVLLYYLFITVELIAADTLFLDTVNYELGIIKYVEVFIDHHNRVNIDSLTDSSKEYHFKKNTESNLNFKFSISTVWLRFTINNKTSLPAYYILSIENPDLNYVSFYQLHNNKLQRAIKTGELRDVRTRDVYHRNFIFNIELKSGETNTYYISVNNGGGPLTIPINLYEKNIFVKSDNLAELVSWSIYGLLLFIFVFNVYLYRSDKDKVSLYYSLSILLAIIFFFCYDGYFYFFNLPAVFSKLKFMYPSLFAVFMLSFTQAFAGKNPNFKQFKKYLNPFKIIAIFAAFCYMLPYPISLVAEFAVPLLILSTFALIIIIAIATFERKYSPSVMFLLAFVAVFLGLLLHELNELNIFGSSFIVENSSKFGLTIECILLTMAVLERFRINQEESKLTIQENYLRIEGQKQELEIINSELEKLSIVASETNNSVAIYDKAGKIEWCNNGFEKYYELTFEDLIEIKKDYIENILPNKYIKDFFKICLENQRPYSFETKIKTKSNNVKWVQTTLTPYPRTGNILKVIAIDSDITELKKFENELIKAKEKAIESDRLKTTFLGNMSHEIRTPLNGILGFTELLGRTNVPEDKRNRYYKIIMSNGEQLIRIIDDIVDISLIESNQLKIDNVEFDLNNLISEVVDFFEIYKTEIDKSGLNLILQKEIGHLPFIVKSDQIRLKQVLTNLIKNCFKFTSEGYVKIECSCNKQTIRFAIEDSGIGVTPEKAAIIFDRFRQADESLSRKYGGTGLGLSISKGIIEKMGGKIWVDPSHQPGFRISFEIPRDLGKLAENRTQEELSGQLLDLL